MVDHSNSRRSDMQKVMQVCLVAGSITLCLSLFLLGDAIAEDGSNGNGTQQDSATVAMRSTATAFPTHPDMAAEKLDVTVNDDYVVTVKGTTTTKTEAPCGDGADCLTSTWKNHKSATGSACVSGVSCMFSGEQTCDNNTGTCTTVDAGGGHCQCICSHP
jgi:hypothetical protein